MKNITKRDVKFFVYAMLAVLAITFAYNWKDFVRGFKDGFEDARNDSAE